MNNSDRKLEEISLLKKELDGLRPLHPEQIKNLKTLFDVEFTYNSTAIEGNTFSYQETKIVLLDGVTVGGKQRAPGDCRGPGAYALCKHTPVR